LLSALAIWSSSWTGDKDKIDKGDGIMMFSIWLVYMIWLVIHL